MAETSHPCLVAFDSRADEGDNPVVSIERLRPTAASAPPPGEVDCLQGKAGYAGVTTGALERLVICRLPIAPGTAPCPGGRRPRPASDPPESQAHATDYGLSNRASPPRRLSGLMQVCYASRR